MSQPNVIHYDSFNELRLSVSSFYLVFGYGTGDTFNALVHLHKAPPLRDYEIIVKKTQLNLVLFLLGLFERTPLQIHVIDHWAHDFSAQVVHRFPTLPAIMGFEPNSNRTGFLDCWNPLAYYNKIIPLDQSDLQRVQGFFSNGPPQENLPEKSVVIFVSAGTNFSDYIPDWSAIVQALREEGLKDVYVNQSGVGHYGEEPDYGATPLRCSHEELIRLAYRPGAGLRLIGVRSGAFDILRFSGARSLVFYQPEPTGVFENCRMGLLSHNLDLIELICLNHNKSHQDKVIDYYIRKFICGLAEAHP